MIDGIWHQFKLSKCIIREDIACSHGTQSGIEYESTRAVSSGREPVFFSSFEKVRDDKTSLAIDRPPPRTVTHAKTQSRGGPGAPSGTALCALTRESSRLGTWPYGSWTCLLFSHRHRATPWPALPAAPFPSNHGAPSHSRME
jgi:hypothetical protein